MRVATNNKAEGEDAITIATIVPQYVAHTATQNPFKDDIRELGEKKLCLQCRSFLDSWNSLEIPQKHHYCPTSIIV